MLHIWLINAHEALPLPESKGKRPSRMASIAQFAIQRGHNVTWWTGTFRHREKTYYRTNHDVVQINPGFKVHLIHALGYQRNVSVARLRYISQLATEFRRWSRAIPEKPDVILASYPTVELAFEAVQYGREMNAPVIIDVRDLWPDALLHVAPKMLRPIGKMVLARMEWKARQAFIQADAIMGITERFVDWGLNKGSRERQPTDRDFPFSYAISPPSDDEIRTAEEYWNSLGIRKGDNIFTICFFGNIGPRGGFPAIIAAARRLRANGKAVRFVLCGNGEWRDRYVEQTADDSNIIWPGWVDQAQIHVLMCRSAAGIDPLPETWDFMNTINNKAVEYLSGGLPLLVSPDRGVLHELVTRNNCGLSYGYTNGDELAKGVEYLMNEPEKRQEMAANARRLYDTMFHPNIVYGGIVDYLESIATSSADAKVD